MKKTELKYGDKKKKKEVKKLPPIKYEFIDSPDNQYKIDRAYDILFEEMEKNYERRNI